ncbi:MAG: AAA family ATPase [Polyangiaceae bacterium]
MRRLARESAKARKETPSTVHLLAAVFRAGGPARRLLEARKLDDQRLLGAARSFDETDETALDLALDGARDVARRSFAPGRAMPARRGSRPTAAPEPGGIHVLVVLLSNRRFAAFRALGQLGVDLANLRAAATRIALGVVAPPRDRRPREREEAAPAREVPPARSDVPSDKPRAKQGLRPTPASLPPKPRRSGRAVQVSLIPPLRPSRDAEPPSDRPATAAPSAPPPQAPPPSPASASSPAAPSPPSSRPEARAPRGALTSEAPAPEADGSVVPAALHLDPEIFPTLAALDNLTALAASGGVEPAVGRDAVVEQVLDVLAKRHGNSPVVVGRAGVGKTTVARAVARRFAAAPLERARLLLDLPAGELLAGTSARGSLADKIAMLRSEVRRAEGRVVLLVDDLFELVNGALDEGIGELKAALAAGELPIVGTATPEDYQRGVDAEPSLSRRFSVVELEEPDEASAVEMVTAAVAPLAEHHGLAYRDEALTACVSWSIRYLPGRALPDKALGVLDLAGARRRRRDASAREVDVEHVAEVMSELCDVPRDRLTETDQARMLAMEAMLQERVIGHDAACAAIAAVLRRNAAGLRGRRPLGTFLLLGPTGVGKTETAKALADVLFHAPEAMTRLDMSEYAEPHAVARLVGAPPGYVGHEAGGLLTEAVRRRPYQVILLDEIEKAHPDVLLTFLQLFDEGRLTDGRGRTVDFTNTVVVLTSNIGARDLAAAKNERRVGFARRDDEGNKQRRLATVAVDAARATLPPELYNRLDEVLFFRHLERDDVRQVARRLLAKLGESLKARGITLDVEEAALDALLDGGGYDPDLGARPMRRAIVRLVEAPLAEMILRGELEEGSVALVDVEDGAIVVDAVGGKSSAA